MPRASCFTLDYTAPPCSGDEASSQPSGAYIFRPVGKECKSVAGGSPVNLTLVGGSLVQEVRQVFSPWLSQTVRLAGTSTARLATYTPFHPTPPPPSPHALFRSGNRAHTMRSAAGERFAEFEWTVGPVDLEDPDTNHTLEECVAWRQTGDCKPDGNK